MSPESPFGDQPTPMPESDAFVFFGASGDLAYKKIFPALHNMVRHETLTGPVIGVAKSGWGLINSRSARGTASASMATVLTMRPLPNCLG